MPPVTTLTLAVMTVGYLIFLKLLLDRRIITLRPLVVFGLAGGAAVVEFAFLISQNIPSQVVLWLFDLDKEKNIPSTYSSTLLLLVGVTGLWIAWRFISVRADWKLILYWLLLGGLFTFLAFDEYYFIHERIPGWHRLYAGIGGFMAVFTLLMAVWFDRRALPLFILLILGLASIGLGGIGFDFAGTPIPFGYVFRYTIEEYLEYIGITLSLFTALTYFQRFAAATAGLRTARLMLAATAVWIVSSLIWTFWPFSWLEVGNSAEQVTIDFLNGDLSLIAVQIEHDGSAGGEIKVSEYWRANAELYGTYAHALKLFDPATNELIVQANIGMQPRIPPTEGWIPGLIYKKEAFVPLDGVAPGDYVLALQAWIEPQAVETLPITNTDHQLVQPDTVVLGEITIRSD